MDAVALGRRILVIGTTGSGKTTVAGRLARARGLPHIELDALHWEPNWQEAETAVFQRRVRTALDAAPDGWVVDGNYFTKVEPITTAAADTLVFLDLPLPLVLGRLVRRTIRRWRTREELWSGNREHLRALFTRDSLLLWALRSHRRNRSRFRQRIDDGGPWRASVRLRTPRQVRRFLDAEAAAGQP
jgi:adenylate kinase family enzyme